MTMFETGQRLERKRIEILAAAQRRFIEDGYAGAGMEAVARDTAISTATLYDHFSSKAELFRCVALSAIEAFSAPPAPSSRGDRAALLTAFAESYALFLGNPAVQMVVRVYIGEPRRFAEVATAFETLGCAAYRRALLDLVRRLDDEGRLATPDPAAAAAQLMGMIEHVALMAPLLGLPSGEADRGLSRACVEAVTTFLARWGQPETSD